MNIKPTSEQCQVWSSQAESFAINIRSQGRHGGKGFAELFNTKFAELVAQWGAEQARDEANNAPSTEHCLWARNGHTPCQHTQQVQAQQTTEAGIIYLPNRWSGDTHSDKDTGCVDVEATEQLLANQAAEIERLRVEWLNAEARCSEYRTKIKQHFGTSHE